MSFSPIRQPPRDTDTLSGRDALRRDASDATVRAGRPATDGGYGLSASDVARVGPAIVGLPDGRATSAALRQARDVAQQVAGRLDQLGAARKALGSVQKLVSHLRDVAVVGLDGSLPPASRVTLQRQVDASLADIDALAGSTPLDPSSLIGSTSVPMQGPGDAQTSTSFRAIGTTALGIADLGVRSPDEAFGSMRLLDRALTRLGTTAASVDGATARFANHFDQLTSPARTADGDAVLASSTAALTSAVLLGDQLLAAPQAAAAVQGTPSPAQIQALLG